MDPGARTDRRPRRHRESPREIVGPRGLERRVGLLGGWGNRIVHIDAASLKAGAADGGILEGREIARLNPPVNVDNFEGIDVRRAADGRLMVYILSDNNFLVLQRTLMMMFEWPEK